jgi:hypothetical protein
MTKTENNEYRYYAVEFGVGGRQNERDYYEDLGVDGRII